MPFIERHPDQPHRVILHTSYVDRLLVRELPGSGHIKRGGEDHWTAPLSWATCVIARGLFRDTLQVGPQLSAWAWEEYRQRVHPCLDLRLRTEPLIPHQDTDLYPFQRAGVEFLDQAQCALLADDMGSGKTVQIIRTLKRKYDRGDLVFPALVICPNSLKLNWRREFLRWWLDGPSLRVIDGSAAQRRQQLETSADITIINYEALKLHTRLSGYGSIRLKRCTTCDPDLPPLPENAPSRCEHCPKELNETAWVTIILDEAHKIKDPDSKQTRAVWGVSRDAHYRYALTGTPIEKDPSELWGILHFLDKNEYPTKSKFIDRYCEKSFNPFGGMEVLGLNPHTREEFFSIVDPRMRRLPREVILPQLPPLIHTERYVEMGAKQGRAYRQMQKRMAVKIDEEILTATNPLAKLGRLMQFAQAFITLDVIKDEDQEINLEEVVTLTEPSNKIDALIDLLEEIGPDEPLVVFAASRQLIDLAAHKLSRLKVPYGLVTGGQHAYEREQVIQDFQAGRIRVFLGTIAAAGEGITLTRARKLVFLSRHWRSTLNEQAERRIHRIGSEHHDMVEIIDIISVNTVEERQRHLLATKMVNLEEIVRDRMMIDYLLGVKESW